MADGMPSGTSSPATPAVAPPMAWPRITHAVLAVSIALPVVLAALLGWKQRWIGDDGFIYLRVVDQLLTGHGLVFNAGERVEAATGPLWVFLIALVSATGIKPETTSVLLGIGFTCLGLLAAQLACVVLLRSDPRQKLVPPLMLPFGALVYVAVPPGWDYASSGLENGLTSGWLGVTFLLLCRAITVSRRPRLVRAGFAVFAGLGPLIRPDLALFGAAWLVVAAYELFGRGTRDTRGGRVRGAIAMFAWAAALPVLYEIFRMGYFAAVVPNTGIAKLALEARWRQGFYYALDFFGRYGLLGPVTLAMVFAFRVARGFAPSMRIIVATLAAALIHAVYVIRLGGDFMHGRLFLPSLFAFLLPVMSVALTSERRPVMISALVIASGWALYCGFFIRHPVENHHFIGDERNWYMSQAVRTNAVAIDDYASFVWFSDARRFSTQAKAGCANGPETPPCRRILEIPDDWTAKQLALRTSPLRTDVINEVLGARMMGAIGIPGFAGGPSVHIIDRHGLAEPIGARIPVEVRGNRPGHERNMSVTWVRARFSAPNQLDDGAVLAARHALTCGELAELVDAVSGPMTWSKFWLNATRARRLTFLAIPSNTYAAETRFCGPIRELPRTEAVGGAGGTPFYARCPEGHVVAGISAMSNADGVTDLGIDCSAKSGGGPSRRFPVKGSGGGPSHTCKFGSVTQLNVYAPTYVRGLGVLCPGEAAPANMGVTTIPSTQIECPAGRDPVGVFGRAGDLIDALGLECSP